LHLSGDDFSGVPAKELFEEEEIRNGPEDCVKDFFPDLPFVGKAKKPTHPNCYEVSAKNKGEPPVKHSVI
jgi:hypothetical protein